METSSLARRLSSRFVAGETLDQALAVARKLNAEGITVTLDHLGESVSTLEEAAEARDVYLRTLNAIHANGIQGNVSLKLTQFGLDLSYDQCLANVDQLVRRAAELGSFVRVDMESSRYTDRTLDLVHTLHAATVAFARKADVDRNSLELPRYLLQKGVYPAIATHDDGVIRRPCRFVTERKIPRDGFEFQMLYGIRRDLQRRLVAEGYRMRLYVPFGKAWYPYYMRRLAERPAN